MTYSISPHTFSTFFFPLVYLSVSAALTAVILIIVQNVVTCDFQHSCTQLLQPD